MDRIIEKQKMLLRRIERNFEDYRTAVLKLDKQSLFDKAAEIAAMKRVSYYMQNIHGYYESDLDYLLKFPNPLKLVAERYQINTREYLHDVVVRVCATPEHTGDYPFRPKPRSKVLER